METTLIIILVLLAFAAGMYIQKRFGTQASITNADIHAKLEEIKAKLK